MTTPAKAVPITAVKEDTMEEKKTEPKLLATYDCEAATVRVYAGPMSDTPEKLRDLIVPAALSFAKAIRKENPELFRQITRPVPPKTNTAHTVAG